MEPLDLHQLGRGATNTGAAPDVNETGRLAWVPLADVQQLIEDGAIVGSGSVTGLLAVMLARATGEL